MPGMRRSSSTTSKRFVLQCLQRVLAAQDGLHVVAGGLQGPLIAEAHHFVVIDDQNFGLFAHVGPLLAPVRYSRFQVTQAACQSEWPEKIIILFNILDARSRDSKRQATPAIDADKYIFLVHSPVSADIGSCNSRAYDDRGTIGFLYTLRRQRLALAPNRQSRPHRRASPPVTTNSPATSVPPPNSSVHSIGSSCGSNSSRHHLRLARPFRAVGNHATRTKGLSKLEQPPARHRQALSPT